MPPTRIFCGSSVAGWIAKATRRVDGSAARAGLIRAGKTAAPAICKALRRVIRGCNKASRIGEPPDPGFILDSHAIYMPGAKRRAKMCKRRRELACVPGHVYYGTGAPPSLFQDDLAFRLAFPWYAPTTFSDFSLNGVTAIIGTVTCVNGGFGSCFPTSPVPLPAALPLFASALLPFAGFAAWRARCVCYIIPDVPGYFPV